MNWKQLPKEKKNNVVLVALLTAIAVGGVGFGLIRFQFDHLRNVRTDTADANKRLSQMKDNIRRADQLENELAEAAKSLSTLEEGMAPPGDMYSWVYETMRVFKLSHRVELTAPSTASPVVDATLLPKFPYKQVTITFSGTGYYHDIGRFLADFENKFPHIRLCNLSVDPLTGMLGGEKEKLEFKVDVVTLVRPNP